jgi:nitroreductase
MPESPQKNYPLPSKNETVLDFLKTRRSNLAKLMSNPGPTEEDLKTILEIGARVPDHRKLSPWRYVVFQGEARANFGKHIASAFMKNNPNMPLDRSLFESQRFLRAPLIIGVISSPVECLRGTPLWEQQLSAGAVCFNLCLAAQAQGFGAQWLTEWYAYDDDVNDALGLESHENVAGYIYVGTVETPATERIRPELAEKLSYW